MGTGLSCAWGLGGRPQGAGVFSDRREEGTSVYTVFPVCQGGNCLTPKLGFFPVHLPETDDTSRGPGCEDGGSFRDIFPVSPAFQDLFNL